MQQTNPLDRPSWLARSDVQLARQMVTNFEQVDQQGCEQSEVAIQGIFYSPRVANFRVKFTVANNRKERQLKWNSLSLFDSSGENFCIISNLKLARAPECRNRKWGFGFWMELNRNGKSGRAIKADDENSSSET